MPPAASGERLSRRSPFFATKPARVYSKWLPCTLPAFLGGIMLILRKIVAVAALLIGGGLGIMAQSEGELVIKIGTPETLKGPDITVRFLEVVEDSRCPKGVDCVWAGRAVIKVELAKPGNEAREFVLEAGNEGSTAVFAGYTVRLRSLSPYPEAEKQIAPENYRAALRIERSPPPRCESDKTH